MRKTRFKPPGEQSMGDPSVSIALFNRVALAVQEAESDASVGTQDALCTLILSTQLLRMDFEKWLRTLTPGLDLIGEAMGVDPASEYMDQLERLVKTEGVKNWIRDVRDATASQHAGRAIKDGHYFGLVKVAK